MAWKPPAKLVAPNDSRERADHNGSMGVINRRAEQRHSCDGRVNLSLDEPVHLEIDGRLVDYSKSGFRAFHNYSELRSGQLVQFRHDVACGTAKVIWNRILPEHVESGFLVV